jgi:hypothetical protein
MMDIVIQRCWKDTSFNVIHAHYWNENEIDAMKSLAEIDRNHL